ncbi:uncharacterized protein LOC131957180 [Physella acuta]|uniref:uncharacterized protein LOC131957180 n=1 Tax=Physella acuta TaxID=109671 RepID=UPI0027DCCE42|nr:uncharacterized protein LOC131957180 [Physella acuta]
MNIAILQHYRPGSTENSMNQYEVSLFTALFALLLVGLSESSPLNEQSEFIMNQYKFLQLAAIFAFLLVILTQSSPLDKTSPVQKRQSADVRLAEFMAWIALAGWMPPRRCRKFACGVVDPLLSGKKKRSARNLLKSAPA